MRAKLITKREQKSETMRTRSFYVMTRRADAEKKDLMKFFAKEYSVLKVIAKIKRIRRNGEPDKGEYDR